MSDDVPDGCADASGVVPVLSVDDVAGFDAKRAEGPLVAIRVAALVSDLETILARSGAHPVVAVSRAVGEKGDAVGEEVTGDVAPSVHGIEEALIADGVPARVEALHEVAAGVGGEEGAVVVVCGFVEDENLSTTSLLAASSLDSPDAAHVLGTHHSVFHVEGIADAGGVAVGFALEMVVSVVRIGCVPAP